MYMVLYGLWVWLIIILLLRLLLVRRMKTLPMNTGDRAPGGGAKTSPLKAGVVVAKASSQPCRAFTVVPHTTN